MGKKREWGGWDENHTYLDIGYPWRPSCAAWLMDPRAPEPDHVCYNIASATVEHFAGQRFIIEDDPFFFGSIIRDEYPLPVGRMALMKWLEKEISLNRQVRADHFVINPLPEFDSMPDARIGLAIKREAWDGDVWLLGPLEPCPLTDKDIAWCIERIKGQPQEEQAAFLYDMIHVPPMRFTEPVLMFEQTAQGRVAKRSPDLARTLWLETWPGDSETAQEKGERLRRWYRANILGKSAGRPKGSGTFKSREDFETTIRAVLASLAASHRDPTQDNVAEYLSNHDRLCGVDGESPNCDARQIRRWCVYWDVEWEDLVGE